MAVALTRGQRTIDITAGVLLCDGEPVGASGERYCYLGELSHRGDGP